MEYGFDSNTDQAYIIPNIYKCQRFVIRPVLGDDFYNQLLKYVEDVKSEIIQQDDELNLLINEYIQPVIAYYVRSEILFSTAYKMKNTSTDNSDKFNELIKISKKYLNDSEGFLELLKKYMCEKSYIIGEDYKFRSSIFLGDTSYMDKDYKFNNSRKIQTIDVLNKNKKRFR